jgi:hypothetical protein
VTLNENDCELAAIKCTDEYGGDYDSNSFNCDNSGVGTRCCNDDSYNSHSHCPAVAYKSKCGDLAFAADCDCTGWDDSPIKSIDCGEDECISFNFDEGSFALSDGDCLDLFASKHSGKKSTRKGKRGPTEGPKRNSHRWRMRRRGLL